MFVAESARTQHVAAAVAATVRARHSRTEMGCSSSAPSSSAAGHALASVHPTVPGSGRGAKPATSSRASLSALAAGKHAPSRGTSEDPDSIVEAKSTPGIDGLRPVLHGVDQSSPKRGHDPSTDPLAILEGHSDRVNSLCLSVDGSTLVSGGDDGYLYIWNLPTPGVEQADVRAMRCRVSGDECLPPSWRVSFFARG